MYFARKRAGGIHGRKEKSTHMQKREERRDEGDLGFFFGNMRKTIEEREEDFLERRA